MNVALFIMWLAIAVWVDVARQELQALEQECVTDSCVFKQCMQENPEWSYSDCEVHIFGPQVESNCADLPPDHPDFCDQDEENQ